MSSWLDMVGMPVRQSKHEDCWCYTERTACSIGWDHVANDCGVRSLISRELFEREQKTRR